VIKAFIRAFTAKMAESVDIDLYENIEEGFDQVNEKYT
jgi:hypothetical protein